MKDAKAGTQPAGGTVERVLVVDDDPDVRLMLRKLFEPNYEVVEAEDGMAAWDIVLQYQLSIVVTDIQMPRLDGLSLCRKIREGGFRRLRIILYTGRPLSAQEMKTVGADDLVFKTEPLSRLLALVANLQAAGGHNSHKP